MRTDSAAFARKNAALAKDPRYVIELAFDSANTVLWYFTSHADAALPPTGVSGSILGVVQGLSGTSQTLSPDTANASIGSINFHLVDLASTVTSTLGAQLQLGRSTRKQRVRIYVGFQGLAWSDYSLVQTQLVTEIAYSDGAYKFSCADIQREMRKDIFDQAKTNLALSVLAADTTIDVVTTTGFSTVAHGTSYGDAPSSTVGYIKIEDEVIRYTGTSATAFTGCVRGALNTRAVDHLIDPTASEDRRTAVTEYIYLELPAVDLMYRLLTGKDRLGNSVLPASWNLGIAPSYVRLSDFTGIGKDLWDTADDEQGFVVRFEDLKKSDGKKFIETELALLIGAFMPIYADGALGLKRMANVLAGAAYNGLIDESNLTSVGDLVHDFGSLHNVITISWNWDPLKQDFTRVDALIDAESIATHGRSDPLSLKFRGLHGSRHSSIIIRQRFDGLRDRFSGPPLRLEAGALPSQNTAEVGDVKRVRLQNVRDYAAPGGGAPLDRSFEIQNIQIDWVTGAIKKKLFGSSQAPGAIAPSTDASVLTTGFYTGTGTALTSALTITGSNPGHISANGNLAGNADMNAAGAIYYYDGDLQIDAGVVVTINSNVQLRVKGFLQVNGKIDGRGRGIAGAIHSPATGPGQFNLGTVGFIGSTESGGGLDLDPVLSDPGTINTLSFSSRGGVVLGKNSVFPSLNLSTDIGVLEGIPSDQRGSSGSSGGSTTIFYPLTDFLAAGGDGGAGGAGLCIVCRGLDLGVAGVIDLSGADGLAGAVLIQGPVVSSAYAGSGGGGAPGGLLVLLDGAGTTVTGLTDAGFIALNGRTPIPPGTLDAPIVDVQFVGLGPFSSYYVGTGDGTTFPLPTLSDRRGGCRVQYVPAFQVAVADMANLGKLFDQIEDIALLNNWIRQPTTSTQALTGMRFLSGAPYPFICGGQTIGGTAGDIVGSKDGALWEIKTNPVSQPIFDFAWNGTCYVAVGGDSTGSTNLLLRSTDGVTWTQQTVPDSTIPLRSVVWASGPGLFVAVGVKDSGPTRVIWTSPDGTTWTARTKANNAVSRVEYGNGVIVAAGNSATTAVIQYSTDGVNWTAATIDSDAGYGVAGLAFGNGVWVGVGGENVFVYSTDNGATWIKGTLPAPFAVGGLARAVAFSGTVFAAVGTAATGTNQGALVASRDGRAWVRRSGALTHMRGVAFGDGYWLTCGNAQGGTAYIATTLRK